MKAFRWFLLFIAFLSLTCVGLVAQMDGSAPIESYVARLSARDHFNSNGQRLQSPAAIIRQDRANYYVYGYRDPEDEPDQFFSSKENRARLERLLERGTSTPEARRLVVNGTPLIRVEVYQNFVNVTIISE
ncbi:MAG: hypothetical protein JO015_13015 [Verrucomicrobia bacterium]|nr:hypothetical protein [Verrucomicrobiota bacterium]